MGIVIKNLKELSHSEWLDFCKGNPNCWLHHKSMIFLPSEQSLSFALTDDNRIIAICPLVIEEKIIDRNTFYIGSLFGLSLPSAVISDKVSSESQIKKINNIICQHINSLADRHKIAKITFNFSSFLYSGVNSEFLRKELIRYGFLDNSLLILLLDLKLSEEEHWKNLSKGHRSILKKFKDSTTCEYLNYKNNPLNFEQFSAMMLKIEKFQPNHLHYLHELFKEGNLEISNLVFKQNIVGSAVFLKYGATVQYHEAERFTNENIPVHHLIVWDTVKKYQKERYLFMDLGVFSYNSCLNYTVSEKSRLVAIFKRGFGAKVLPFIIGEKYFDSGYFDWEYQQRISAYKKEICSK
ncbi:MAG: hypothetical protein KBB01_01975 [Candidatus Omnitrophica bacterium]|jgi:hypothetical protein|nr:hypothetical protein [Candidatus Omnitrophota bacterium]